ETTDGKLTDADFQEITDHFYNYFQRKLAAAGIDSVAWSTIAGTDFYKTADLIRVGFLPDQTETELHIDGFQNLVNSLQGREREKVEQILFLLEDKKLLKEFFSKYIHNDGVSTYIAEPDDEIFAGMSVIATNYRLGEKKIGSIGILGPNRMNYNKGLSLVEFTSKLLSEMITRMSK
ncbi:MAG TPA: HrcA family transcriptional regulator, partial [Leptospiraceae bacterium]|nr:HrcA family transcriptional regulator [Leptospiraceae bacterium]